MTGTTLKHDQSSKTARSQPSNNVIRSRQWRMTSPRTLRLAVVCGVLLAAGPAFAATSGGEPMPWEGPMDRMFDFFTGPFVRIAAVIAIILMGLAMAFSENGTGMRKLTTGFFGIALAFGAATWGLSFFGFSGGATIDGVMMPEAENSTFVADHQGAEVAEEEVSVAFAPTEAR